MKYDTDSAHIASKVEEILENFKRDDVQKDPNISNMSN
jgi:predicted oxidoreductase